MERSHLPFTAAIMSPHASCGASDASSFVGMTSAGAGRGVGFAEAPIRENTKAANEASDFMAAMSSR